MAVNHSAAIVRKSKPVIHFVFAQHAGKDTYNAVKSVIEAAKQQKRVVWIGQEMASLNSLGRGNRKNTHWVQSQDPEHNRLMRGLIKEHKLPVKWVEFARKKQTKKIRKLLRYDRKGFQKRLSEVDFRAAMNFITYDFYGKFNQHMARHAEVARNLKKEVKGMKDNEMAIIPFGSFHKGLDKYVSEKLGVNTERTGENGAYSSLRDELFEEIFSNSHKPTRDQLARIALEELLGNEFAVKFVLSEKKPSPQGALLLKKHNEIKKIISTLSEKEISSVWETFSKRLEENFLSQKKEYDRYIDLPVNMRRMNELKSRTFADKINELNRTIKLLKTLKRN